MWTTFRHGDYKTYLEQLFFVSVLWLWVVLSKSIRREECMSAEDAYMYFLVLFTVLEIMCVCLRIFLKNFIIDLKTKLK